MTQGFQSGQPPLHPQQVQPQPGPPQQPYPQPGGHVPPGRAWQNSSRGWLVLLFLAALAPLVVSQLTGLLVGAFDVDYSSLGWLYELYWQSYALGWAVGVVQLAVQVSAVSVLFRSNVGRWILVVTSGLMVLNGILGMAVSLAGSKLDWGLFEVLYLPILVIALLPPVNRALRKAPQGAGMQPAMGYGGQPISQQAAYPQAQSMQPQPQQFQQPQQAYGQQSQSPQQQWQQSQYR